MRLLSCAPRNCKKKKKIGQNEHGKHYLTLKLYELNKF